ncbi:XRE family transcriptional regulator [Methylobacterium sp. J-030]|uniref:helix-turn-helix domain-containing protein n=1 Tax=Methylobacterium sp. J-030 TaxID=2836627 RepID=UPI001FBB7DDB|nr:XRE family transcriptional regulator [Methylobacterium sp. J-030]MCJ2071344.1 XRE family transcriptional regulator [Methylobacterium sp. J-030]
MADTKNARASARTAEGLGNRVKALRRRRGLTLEQLSAATGLNKGYLSRIENGEKVPSISTALKLAQAMDVPTGMLFGETVDDDDIHVARSVDRSPLHEPAGSGRYALTPLSEGALASRVESYLMHPSSDFEADDRAQHAGTEAIYVVDGHVAIAFADRTVELAAGDYIQFPGHLAHHVRRTGATAIVLIVIAHS